MLRIRRRHPDGVRPPAAPRVGAVQDLIPPLQLEGHRLRAGPWRWQLFRLDPEPTAAVQTPPDRLRIALVDPLPAGMRLRLWRAVRFDAAGREAYLRALHEAGADRSPWGSAYMRFLEEAPLSRLPAVYGAVGWVGDREREAETYLQTAQEILGGLARLSPVESGEILAFLAILARQEVIR